MMKIPIQFEHRGRAYSGHLDKVAGAGNSATWHLYDDEGYYLGRLRTNSKGDWVFDESRPADELRYLAVFFGRIVDGR